MEELNEIHEESDAVVEDNIEQVEENTTKKDEVTKIGKVNCARLAVREEPTTNSDVLGVIEEGSSVLIDEYDHDDFYMICTESGLEGFCMKQFIDIE